MAQSNDTKSAATMTYMYINNVIRFSSQCQLPFFLLSVQHRQFLLFFVPTFVNVCFSVTYFNRSILSNVYCYCLFSIIHSEVISALCGITTGSLRNLPLNNKVCRGYQSRVYTGLEEMTLDFAVIFFFKDIST